MRLSKKGVFDLGMNEMKSYFFRVHDWTDVLEPAEYTLLMKIGLDLKEQGRSNIRRRKNPSRKDRPPTSWGPGHKLKRSIFFGIDEPNMTVFAGPVKFDGNRAVKPIGQPTVPAVLEYGGRMWNRWYAPHDPPRVRDIDGLPSRRVSRIQARPYMSLAYEKKEKKILRMTENFILKSPSAVLIADNKSRTLGGTRPL